MHVANTFLTSIKIFGVILLLLGPFVFSALILRMIDKAAKLRKRPVKYLLVDFFSLIFLIQVPFAIMSRSYESPSEYSSIAGATLVAIVMAFLWRVTIETVSRAGITKTAARVWISFLVIPITFVGSFVIIGFGLNLSSRYYYAIKDRETIAWTFAAEGILLALMIFAFFKTRQIVRESSAAPAADEIRHTANPFDD